MWDRKEKKFIVPNETAVLRWDGVKSYVDDIFDAKEHKPDFKGIDDTWDNASGGAGWMGKGKSWDAGVSGKESCRKAVSGDITHVAKCKNVVSKLANNVALGPRYGFVPSLAGTRVSVPDYIGGNPKAMRSKQRKDGQCRHVNVYVELTSSQGIDADDLIKRGSVIVALVEQLQASQVNVDLHIMCGTDAGNGKDLLQVIKLDSSPIDLSVASFALAHPSFPRNVMYMMARPYGFTGGWPYYSDRGYDKKNEIAAVKKLLSLSETDIYIPSVYWNDQLLSNPEQWLNERMTQVGVACSPT